MPDGAPAPSPRAPEQACTDNALSSAGPRGGRSGECSDASCAPRGSSALIARLPRLAPGKPRFGSSTRPGGKPGSRGKLRNSWVCWRGRGKCVVLCRLCSPPLSLPWSLWKAVAGPGGHRPVPWPSHGMWWPQGPALRALQVWIDSGLCGSGSDALSPFH